MIVPILLVLQSAATAPPPMPADDEIVVIGRRLQNWRATFRMKKGVMQCRVKVSTGDVEIDRIGCAAMEACFPDAIPRYEAANDRALSADVRKHGTDAINQELGACVLAKRTASIAELAARRAVQRGAK